MAEDNNHNGFCRFVVVFAWKVVKQPSVSILTSVLVIPIIGGGIALLMVRHNWRQSRHHRFTGR